jgi:hypothetical protein
MLAKKSDHRFFGFIDYFNSLVRPADEVSKKEFSVSSQELEGGSRRGKMTPRNARSLFFYLLESIFSFPDELDGGGLKCP